MDSFTLSHLHTPSTLFVSLCARACECMKEEREREIYIIALPPAPYNSPSLCFSYPCVCVCVCVCVSVCLCVNTRACVLSHADRAITSQAREDWPECHSRLCTMCWSTCPWPAFWHFRRRLCDPLVLLFPGWQRPRLYWTVCFGYQRWWSNNRLIITFIANDKVTSCWRSFYS